MKRAYGWKPDLPDHRDLKYGAIHKPDPDLSKYPNYVDLRDIQSPVEDQQTTSSCVFHSLTSALECLEIKNDKSSTIQYSRLFAYYNTRVLEGDVNSDAGAFIRDGIKSLNKQGCCLESSWPFDVKLLFKKPTQKCYQEATKHHILQYSRLSTLEDMIHCISDGYPFVFGFSVYEYFESDEMAKTGLLKLPEKNEKDQGGHAILAVGFDQTKKLFLIKNSWGRNWGLNGYFWMPFDYISNPDLADDFWTIRKMEL